MAATPVNGVRGAPAVTSLGGRQSPNLHINTLVQQITEAEKTKGSRISGLMASNRATPGPESSEK